MGHKGRLKTATQQAPVHGIIFDLDGTLIKSVVDFPKMKYRMLEYIKDLNYFDTDYTISQTTNVIIKDFHQRLIDVGISESDRKGILNNISDILTEVEFENINKVELLPGVKDFLLDSWNDGIKMGILTRASQKYTQKTLDLTTIKKYFTIILSRDEFTLLKAKPHPYALNYIIDQLKIAPDNILFVGDHKIDYDCAQTGNIRFVGVLSGPYSKPMLNDIGCEMLVEDFFELAKLVKKINYNKKIALQR